MFGATTSIAQAWLVYVLAALFRVGKRQNVDTICNGMDLGTNCAESGWASIISEGLGLDLNGISKCNPWSTTDNDGDTCWVLAGLTRADS